LGDDWHEYFEDYPEENPANYWPDGRFEIGAAAKHRALQEKAGVAAAKLRTEQAALDAKIARVIADADKRVARRKSGTGGPASPA
jgi:multidrug resistance efflux pump